MMQNDNVLVEDLGSTNGTFLNGERIANPQQLRPGDVITLGESIVLVFERAGYDPDATVVSTRGQPTVQRRPEPQAYQPPADPSAYKQPQPSPQAARPQKSPARREAGQKKGGFPAWLIILFIAIVVVGCVIAVTLYFMPASWWCALTFNMLEGCPLP